MKRRVAFAALAVACFASLAAADEGMWMLHQIKELDQAKLKAMGLQLTPEQIWDPATGTGLASAVCSLGGCSASFVSPDGLIATNHHCAFRAIQMNSTPEHDYITDGFLAASKEQELEAKGSRVYVFLGYDDVTDRVRGVLTAGMSPLQRTAALERAEKELAIECEKPGLRCRVAEMFGGGSYYLFRTLEIRDVRLVYAPPRAIGEYGGETDNWMWPRHTGDFSFLRAYVGPDNAPADYSPANVPYKPVRWLKVGGEQLKPGDFAMILGYPGKTTRFRPAAGVRDDVDFALPTRIAILTDWIAILQARSATDKAVEIKLASLLKGLLNSYKKYNGELEGLRAIDLAGRHRGEEEALTAWIRQDPARIERFGDPVAALGEIIAAQRATRERDLLLEWLPRSSSLLQAAVTIERWTSEKAKAEVEREFGFQSRDERLLRLRQITLQRDLDIPTERAELAYFLGRAVQLPAGQRLVSVDEALAATGKEGAVAITALLDRLFTTALADQGVRLALFAGDHAAVVAAKDPMLDFALSLRRDLDAKEAAGKATAGQLVMVMPRYINALTEFQKRPVYPDANSTLRFTYATVEGFAPRDGVVYTPFTTLAGTLAKDTGEEPFNVPQHLREEVAAGHTERWSNPELKDVPVCFLTTNDITGGNSGSPIMNGKGELVGLAFDGNYESLVSDYEFVPDVQRTINVDEHYMLWVMDEVNHAHRLLEEMGIQPTTH